LRYTSVSHKQNYIVSCSREMKPLIQIGLDRLCATPLHDVRRTSKCSANADPIHRRGHGGNSKSTNDQDDCENHHELDQAESLDGAMRRIKITVRASPLMHQPALIVCNSHSADVSWCWYSLAGTVWPQLQLMIGSTGERTHVPKVNSRR